MSEEKKIPANQHPAYLRLVSELQSKGMTVESKLPANADDCDAVYCGAFLIHAGNDDWETDPDRFKNLVDNVDPSKHRCRIKPGWSPYRPDLLLLGYDVWKDAGVE
jgi:hypothetical protein